MIIDSAELDRRLTAEPESVRELGRIIADSVNFLEEELVHAGICEQERREAVQVFLRATFCHFRKEPPPNEEVGFWMRMLDPAVTLADDPKVQ